MISVLADVAARARYRPTGGEGRSYVTNFIGHLGQTSTNPGAFLVEVPSGHLIKPHFHGTNQYQLVVGGAGTIGKEPLAPGAFHYADAYTPYGPIVAGDDGLSFFTLRQTEYDGHHRMPGSSEMMKAPAGRGFVAAVVLEGRPPSLERLRCDEDGVAAFALRADPAAELDNPEIDHGGAYYVVLRGGIVCGLTTYGPCSLFWVAEAEAAPRLSAGHDGATVVLLSFPRTPPTRRGTRP